MLRADGPRVTVRADAMAADRDLLLIRAAFGKRYAYLVLDERGFISAFARGDSQVSAYGRVRDELARTHRYELGSSKDQGLRTEQGRRPARIEAHGRPGHLVSA